ncbi:PQQ-binding-like beta-propeller repeat protein [Conexibacter stalactiti]|uniref:PQQ-binding-like beta-propeller repeat protein n=1 Tax=Conexibacter stalactiti TaxID=1940611 RepID=A0ABU4HZG2_9ACTN|nr:PQQ-binding-like beta-propeller repeat protein [Conexibacter stalactiti]MDW5597454.1 PQQ-binding-like beta-propeller repeat protein [Conexibacter stalactiti]MEC5038096.1 PQQ-binding-like beta-propeller repeat protein [Conexibacter stalactiti]
MRAAVAALVLAAALALAGCGGGGGDDATPPPGPPADVGWPRFGNDDDQSRFSPLAAVDRDSVDRLGLAWSWAPEEMALWESFPVVAGRTLYVTTNTSQVIAFNAATGARRWTYTPQVDFFAGGAVGQQPTNRGVAVEDGRVYLVTYDARLVALDAATGRELWSTRVADPRSGTTGSSPPTFWQGRLIVGSSGSDARGSRGFVAAFDADEGEQLWRFWTVAEGRGGGRVWMPPTVDARSGIVYAGTGNPSPALSERPRRGCERWVSGMVALDARDGTLKWGANEVCGDVWDYDGGQPPLLYETRVDGRDVRAVGHANKSGTYWIRDAESGRRLAPPRALIAQTTPRPRPSRRGTTICPGALGGVAYGPAAHDPRSRTIFQGAVRMCMTYRTGDRELGGAPVLLGGGSARSVPGRRARGTLVALDDGNGRVRWRRTLPAPLAGGVLATAGGLVFSGLDDGWLYAFDAGTGETAWRGRVGLPFGSAPLTYRVGGIQYVAIVAGGSTVTQQTGTRPGARLLVLRLGGRPLPAR